ncbi:hypothetical protein [Nitrososphaera viennensis]|uniref:Uncharacterized protein n=2 Tax=Nitrososphaera viennensis TaxID=1034015 RepID=A0A060HJU2_9ARCH|nr:hypothetical protein [Nitrososphaera viennensis]AIC15540.1 hypothetical protein NVIE_013050 [Nitrososphaera viennensis EN76]UVS70425.1 hypothetical protein NWT39_06470 [Nitrososphaera viennensis]
MESGTGAPSREEVRSDSGRSFLLEANFYGNGCFLAISEGGNRRIGAISVAISSQNNTTAAKVIPSKSDPLFVNTIAEKVASMINGICIVSFYAKGQLKLEDMKAIMGGVMHIVEAEGNNSNGNNK